MTNVVLNDIEAIIGPILASVQKAASETKKTAVGPYPVTDLCPPKDVALIQRVREGDSQAFYELIQPYQRAVFSAALSIVKDRDAADDIAQESFLKALRYLSGFRMQCRFSTWLIQIAINEARLWLRKSKYVTDSLDETVEGEDGTTLVIEVADARPIPSEIVATNELRAALQEAILELPQIYREVFVLRDVQRRSIRETAKALGITEETVKTRLLRARLKMRSALQAFHEQR